MCCLECEKGVKALGNWTKGLNTHSNIKNIGERAVTGMGTKAECCVQSGLVEFAMQVGYADETTQKTAGNMGLELRVCICIGRNKIPPKSKSSGKRRY